MTTIAMTGHRPEKIPDKDRLMTNIYIGLRIGAADMVIQGMAAGVDLWSAKLAHGLGIPYTCARPWAAHAPRVADRHDYEQAMKYAARVVSVSPADHYPGPWIYQKRNEWMVDNCDVVFACWDGSSGGTANCVRYALEKGKRIMRYNPKTDYLAWMNETL